MLSVRLQDFLRPTPAGMKSEADQPRETFHTDSIAKYVQKSNRICAVEADIKVENSDIDILLVL